MNMPLTTDTILPLLGRYQMLSQLQREMTIDQAIADIICTPEEVANARQQFCQQRQISTESALQGWLKNHYLTPEALDTLVVRSLRIEKFKQQTWENHLESYFLKRKRQLDRLVYLLLRTRDSYLAQELYLRIQGKEQSFVDLAREYSQGSEAQTGGFVGPVEAGTLHPGMVQRLITSQPGELLTPMRLGDWIVIVQLEKIIPAQLDMAMRQRLLNELFENWLTERMSDRFSQAA
jgi:parvulin-like peptidyl-prolyl isomerase